MKWYQMRWTQKYWGKKVKEHYRRYLQSETWKAKRKSVLGGIARTYKILKEHAGNIKVLLILIAMLISIAAREVAVLAACLALAACVDEIRIQRLFKERRQLMNMIKELRLSIDTQTGEIKTLQVLSHQVENAVNTQTGEIKTLQGLNREVKAEVRTQTRKINTLILGTALGVVISIVFGILGLLSDAFLHLLIGIHGWLTRFIQ